MKDIIGYLYQASKSLIRSTACSMLSSMLALNLVPGPSCFCVHCVPFGIPFFTKAGFLVEPTVHYPLLRSRRLLYLRHLSLARNDLPSA
jgi:hypothetical protein